MASHDITLDDEASEIAHYIKEFYSNINQTTPKDLKKYTQLENRLLYYWAIENFGYVYRADPYLSQQFDMMFNKHQSMIKEDLYRAIGYGNDLIRDFHFTSYTSWTMMKDLAERWPLDTDSRIILHLKSGNSGLDLRDTQWTEEHEVILTPGDFHISIITHHRDYILVDVERVKVEE